VTAISQLRDEGVGVLPLDRDVAGVRHDAEAVDVEEQRRGARDARVLEDGEAVDRRAGGDAEEGDVGEDANWCACETTYADVRSSRTLATIGTLVMSPRVPFQNSCRARL
jgi:hypothetical protein